jgi:hypothetical protein
MAAAAVGLSDSGAGKPVEKAGRGIAAGIDRRGSRPPSRNPPSRMQMPRIITGITVTVAVIISDASDRRLASTRPVISAQRT